MDLRNGKIIQLKRSNKGKKASVCRLLSFFSVCPSVLACDDDGSMASYWYFLLNFNLFLLMVSGSVPKSTGKNIYNSNSIAFFTSGGSTYEICS